MGRRKLTFDGVNASRRRVGFLAAAVFAGIAILPIPTVAAVLRCASHSLNRDEIARVEAVARPALPASGHLAISFVCWNPDFAVANFENRKVRTREGVTQCWSIACQRDGSTWTCDPAEFEQFIAVDLPVADQSHRVDLNLGKGITLERARSLALRALSIYADPGSRLPECGTGVESGTGPVGTHRADRRASAAEPFHVSVSRAGLWDSVALDAADLLVS